MPRFRNRPFLATVLSFLSSRAQPSGSAVRHSCARSYRSTTSANHHRTLMETPTSPCHSGEFAHPGFQEWSAEPQIPRLRSVEKHSHEGSVEPQIPPLRFAPAGMTKEGATVLQRVVAGPRRFSSPSVGRGPMTTRDDKKERIVARKGRFLNRGILKI